MYNCALNIIILFWTILQCNSYSISDVNKIEIVVISSKNNTYNLPIKIVDSNFRSKIIGLPTGLTTIIVSGITNNNNKLFEGSWKGILNNIDNDIIINMLDLEINPTLIGEMPPYFNSVNIMPTRINPGDVVKITAYADDFNQNDGNSLTYDVLGFDNYLGKINYISTVGKKLEFTYNSNINESLGIRNGIIKVSDNKYYSTTPISFTIDTIQNINTQIITSHNPKIESIKTDKSHLKFGDFAIITAIISDEENSPIQFIWSIESITGNCLDIDVIGQKNGVISFSDLSIQYKPTSAEVRKCKINLYIYDNTMLNASAIIYIETNTQIINHSPNLVFGYQSSYSASINSTISFVVRGEEIDGDDLQFKWYTEGNIGTLTNEYYLFQNTYSEKPFIETSNNELVSSGKAGKVICEIIDSYNSKYIQEFNIADYNRRRLTEVNSFPIYFHIKNGEIEVYSNNQDLSNKSVASSNTNTVIYLNQV